MLRPASAEDLAALVALARHPAVAGTLSTRAADTLTAESAEVLAIKDRGRLVGGVCWALVNRRSRIAEVRTLMLDPAARGRGLAVATIRELAARLVHDHAIHRVEAEVYGFNGRAQRVFERAGFTREGLRRRAYHRAGGWQDGVRFGLLAEELIDNRRCNR